MLLRTFRRSGGVTLGGLRRYPRAFSSVASEQGAAAVGDPSDESSALEKEKKPKKPQQQSVVTTTWEKLVVGEIVELHAHPQADRLNVCAVNVGDQDVLLQIICGAPNVRQGARVPVAKVGSRLAIKERETGELKKLKIKKSKLRGEVSQGMICSEEELGLADSSDGILILEDDALIGGPVLEHGTIASRLQARGMLEPSKPAVIAPTDTNSE